MLGIEPFSLGKSNIGLIESNKLCSNRHPLVEIAMSSTRAAAASMFSALLGANVSPMIP